MAFHVCLDTDILDFYIWIIFLAIKYVSIFLYSVTSYDLPSMDFYTYVV